MYSDLFLSFFLQQIRLMDISEAIEQDDKKELQEYLQIVCRMMKCSEIGYWIGNPSVEITSGDIFLQKMNFPQVSEQKPLELLINKLRELNHPESRCLALMGIPNSKSPIEISEAIGDQVNLIEESRVVKTSDSGFYGVLMRFSDQTKAKQFFSKQFGRPYNFIEKELILLRPIEGITLSFDEFNIDDRKIEFGLLRKKSSIDQPSKITPQGIFVGYNLPNVSQGARPNFTCAICFEQMGHPISRQQSSPTKFHSESTDKKGIVSILCGHYFHWECLGRWTEKTCPLCRYHQQPPKLSFCESCNISDGLWICLICGKKLCSGQFCDLTSPQSHIYLHYKQQGHTLAMQIETKFVYDFHTRDFIHRVYHDDSGRPQGQKKEKDKKDISQLVKQYNYMMKDQMDQQRIYFDKEFDRTRRKYLKSFEDLCLKRNKILNQIRQIEEICSKDFSADQQQVKQLQIELATAQKYHKMLVDRSKVIMKQVQQEQQKERQLEEQLNQQIRDMREQVKDVQRNIEFNRKMKKKMQGQKIASEYFFNTKK